MLQGTPALRETETEGPTITELSKELMLQPGPWEVQAGHSSLGVHSDNSETVPHLQCLP